MMSQEIPYKIYLSEEEMPKQWYNVRADMKNKRANDTGRARACILYRACKAGA